MDILISEKSEIVDDAESPVDVRELAYQYWSFLSGRNAAATSRKLKEIGHDVDDRLIRYWASSGEWAKRAADDLVRIAPDIRRQTIAELIYGAHEASYDAREVRRQLEAGEIAPDVAKVRLAACELLLKYGGFSPVGSNAPELPRVSVAEQAKAYRDMTPEERIEEQRRQLDAQRLPAKTPRRKR